MQQKKSMTVLASFFILAGITLMLENFNIISGVSRLWPGLISFLEDVSP